MIARPTLDWAGLYAAEQGRLRRLLGRLVGSSTGAAEDLLQQTFLNVLTRTREGDLACGAAYLTTTARNLALNHLRDARRRNLVDIGEEAFQAIPDGRPSPEMEALFRAELRRVLEAIAALPPRRREAFVLHRFEGLSHDQIAARQGISRNTVISQIVAALAELDRRLGRS